MAKRLRDRRVVCVAISLAVAASMSCERRCGLGWHDRVSVPGVIGPGGESFFRDMLLSPQVGDMEIALASTAHPAEPGSADAFLTATSCTQLFSDPYPGAAPLCRILVGPVTPGQVTTRVPLDSGTYRLWVQGYTSNASALPYLIDVEIWDESCRSPLQ